MGRKYRNPPLVEALCEFQFEPSQPWDLTIPGLFYERVCEGFPEKRQQEMVEMELRAREARLEQRVRAGIARVQFLRRDGTALVQVGPDLLAVNHLKPYPTWAQFRPMILKHLEIYRDLAKPNGLRRVGLRYINRIEVPGPTAELARYLNFYPPQPKDLPQPYESFLVRVETPYSDERDRLLLTTGSAQPETPAMTAVILDLDYVMGQPGGISLTQVEQWLEEAHDRIELAFEACITPQARDLFEEMEG
jgi:uncharacterized protein (TIGR04255 family)